MNTSRQPLRYSGSTQHADWCPGPPDHDGYCLDVLLAKIDAIDAIEPDEAE